MFKVVMVLLPVLLAAAGAAGLPGEVSVEYEAVPGLMNVQGRLTDADGNPVNGVRAMIFRIYRDDVLQWEESRDVTVREGLFSLELGQVVPIPAIIFATGTRHELELLVTGQALVPRVGLTSTGFAFRTAGLDRPLTPAIADNEIADGAVTMAKINRSGASTGQVIMWTGTAWAPRDGGGGGGGVSSVGQGRGIVCTPNPIVSTGTVRLDTSYTDERYIRNQADYEQSANFLISGAGQAEQFAGVSGTADVPGIYGDGGRHCTGVYGEATDSDWAGVTGLNEAADGVGLVGFGRFAGVAGQVEQAAGSGVFGANLANAGTGIIGTGNDQPGQYLSDGSGGAFTGRQTGVFGYATGSSGNRGGGYFSEPGGGFAWVSANVGGISYKIGGQGQVSTTMPTRDGDKALFAPEMPSPWLEDCGRARLQEGHCRVDLDPLFWDCVTINEQHPLLVFVQLNDDCRGVYVKTDAYGFDVYELEQGRSNAEFTWRALGRWKGYEDVRMPVGLPRLETGTGSELRPGKEVRIRQ